MFDASSEAEVLEAISSNNIAVAIMRFERMMSPIEDDHNVNVLDYKPEQCMDCGFINMVRGCCSSLC